MNAMCCNTIRREKNKRRKNDGKTAKGADDQPQQNHHPSVAGDIRAGTSVERVNRWSQEALPQKGFSDIPDILRGRDNRFSAKRAFVRQITKI